MKVGVRFTMTSENHTELPMLLDLIEAERIDKFYLSHLVYAGRGNKSRGTDADWTITRNAMTMLFERAWAAIGVAKRDFVTGNNDADGVFLLFWAQTFPGAGWPSPRQARAMGRQFVRRERRQYRQSRQCSSRYDVATHTLRQREERPFGKIWKDVSDPIMAGLKTRPRKISGVVRLRLFRHLRRQHARSGFAPHRRRFCGRSGLLPRQFGNRRGGVAARGITAVQGIET